MTLATLSEVLCPALEGHYAVAGLVCLGWEDMRAYVDAAEAEGVPVILQAGPGCRANTPLPVLGAMFTYLAENSSVPIVVHLDHSRSFEECRQALDCGFTSLMFDGSSLPLAQNIAETAKVVEFAHAAGMSCEGEIGYVGYAGGMVSQGTDPAEAALFAKQTGVDALAISAGNLHLQQGQGAGLDEALVRAIERLTPANSTSGRNCAWLSGLRCAKLSIETRPALIGSKSCAKLTVLWSLRPGKSSLLSAAPLPCPRIKHRLLLDHIVQALAEPIG